MFSFLYIFPILTRSLAVLREFLQKEGQISRETNFPLQLRLRVGLLLLLCTMEVLTEIRWLTGINQGIMFFFDCYVHTCYASEHERNLRLNMLTLSDVVESCG